SSSPARARRAEEGGAKLMMYGGEGEIEAAGAKVAVPEGMGTSVAAAGPPGPPEKLLPAPQPVAPAAGGQVQCANPRFGWTGVPDAASYTVEVCRDPSCGALIERAVGLDKLEWRAPALPKGDLYWRVTARSLSGLDGYPSEPVRLTIASDRTDVQGPKEVLSIDGPQVRVVDALWAGPTAHVIATSVDPETGEPVTRELTQTAADLGAFAAQTAAAEGGLASTTSDSCGNAGSFQPFVFAVDAQPPARRPQSQRALLVGRRPLDAPGDRSAGAHRDRRAAAPPARSHLRHGRQGREPRGGSDAPHPRPRHRRRSRAPDLPAAQRRQDRSRCGRPGGELEEDGGRG